MLNNFSKNIFLTFLFINYASAQGVDSSADAFNSLFEDQKKAFEEYKNDEINKYEEYEKKVKQIWPDGLMPSEKKYVKYLKDESVRISIDYDQGNIAIEAAKESNPKESKNDLLALQDLVKNAVSEYLSQKSDTNAEALVKETIKEQFENVSITTISDKLSKIVDEGKKIIGDDKVERKKFSFNTKMLPNFVSKNAAKFKEDVQKMSLQTNVPIALIYAIIRQESSFNPMARSHIPAYGLMQIVPQYAGQEVLTDINRSKTIPDSEYLYNPSNNIMVGSMYVSKLLSTYFKDVKDTDKKIYLSICSYNWGPGRIKNAIKSGKLNTDASKEELFEKLKEIAPEETRNYLIRVTKFFKEFSSI